MFSCGEDVRGLACSVSVGTDGATEVTTSLGAWCTSSRSLREGGGVGVMNQLNPGEGHE